MKVILKLAIYWIPLLYLIVIMELIVFVILIKKITPKMIDSQFFEYGISSPFFHIIYEFPDRKEIPEIIKLSKINYNITKNRNTRDRCFKVLSQDSFLVYNKSAYMTIFGKNSTNVYLYSNIRKIENTPTYLYIQNKTDFLSYDYTNYKVWDTVITDFCTVDDNLYTIEKEKFLNIYKKDECIKSIKMKDKCYMIRGNPFVLVLVDFDNQVITYDMSDLSKATVIERFDTKIIDLVIQGSYIALRKSNRLIVIDVPNKRRQKIKYRGYHKFVVVDNFIIANIHRGAFKYYELTNLQNSKIVQYDELCSGLDVFDNKLYLLSNKGIHMWSSDGKKEDFFSVKYRPPYFDLSNTLFEENCKFSLKEESFEKVTYIEMGITELINEEKQRICNVNNKGDQESIKFNFKKKKIVKGGF